MNFFHKPSKYPFNLHSKIKGYSVILIFHLALFFSSTAQQFIYQNFTTEDGLPSSECYDVIQDKKGYIWIATDKGIAKYNGQEFNVFDQEDGLKSSVVFRLLERNGRIWFFTYNKHLQYIENDSVKTPSYSLKLKNILDSIIADPRVLSVNENNEILVSVIQTIPPFFYFKVDSLDNILFQTVPIKKHASINVICEEGYDPIYGCYIRKDNKRIELSYPAEVGGQSLNLGQRFNNLSYLHFSVMYENKKPRVFTIEDRIYVMKDNTIMDSVYTNGLLLHGALFNYNKNNFIHGRRDGSGLLLFALEGDSISLLDSSNHDLKNISGAMMDRENSLWLTSLRDGAFFVINPSMKSLTNLLGATEITGIHVVNDELWVAADIDHLYSLNLNDFSIKQHLEFPYEIFDLTGTNKSLLVYTKLPSKAFSEKVNIRNFGGHAYYSNDSIWFASRSNMFLEVNGIEVDSSHFSDGAIPRLKAMHKWGNYIYLGSLNGLLKYSIKEKKLIRESEVNSGIVGRINRIIDFKDNLILATNGQGLLILDKKDSIVSIIDKTKGLSSNFCQSIFRQNDSTFWVSTNSGINRLVFSTLSGPLSFTIQVINKSQGLISDEVNHCLVANNTLFVGTKKGLCYMDLNDLKTNNVPPQVYIERLVVSDSLVEMGTNGEYRYDKNDFRFSLAGLTYKTRGKFKFKYRLIKNDEPDAFVSLNQPTIQFADLSPGDYFLEVVAVNNNGVPSVEPASYGFTIFPAWWNTWWFRTFYISGILFLFYSFYRYRYQQKKARDQLDLTTKKLKQKALNAQLNPHFIFNTMGSIQSLIIDEKLPEAEGYLTKFSKMLRTILSSSDEHFINLKNELELVAEYVKLENLRFDNRIDLKLNVEGVTSGNVFQAPTLLILTLVENAILHGILPSKKSGRIEITTRIDSKDSSRLQIIIEDNGIGILQSKEIKKSKIHSHKSMGLNIIKDRLETYSSLYKGSFSIQFIDLSTLEEDKTGTRVEIFTPYKAE